MRQCALLLCLATQLSASSLDEAVALSARQKFQQITDKSVPSGTAIEFSEGELNALLRVQGAPLLPAGVKDPELSLREGGAVLAAQVDLEAAGEGLDSVPVLMRLLLKGTRDVVLDLDLAIKDGRGRLKLVSMLVEGVEIPESVMTWFLKAYAPEEFRPYLMGEEAEIQVGLSDLSLEPGRAVAIVE